MTRSERSLALGASLRTAKKSFGGSIDEGEGRPFKSVWRREAQWVAMQVYRTQCHSRVTRCRGGSFFGGGMQVTVRLVVVGSSAS